MSRPLNLDEFGSGPGGAPAPTRAPGEDSDDVRLDVYETGYKCGWDDASAARDAEEGRLAADLSRSIQEMRFTYEEARAEVLGGLAPLLDGIVGRLLPAIAAEAVAPLVAEELDTAIGNLGHGRCEILAAPSSCPALERLADRHVEAEIVVRPEPAYAEGHVTLRFADEQREIDLDAAAARIGAAIREFIDQQSPQDRRLHA